MCVGDCVYVCMCVCVRACLCVSGRCHGQRIGDAVELNLQKYAHVWHLRCALCRALLWVAVRRVQATVC